MTPMNKPLAQVISAAGMLTVVAVHTFAQTNSKNSMESAYNLLSATVQTNQVKPKAHTAEPLVFSPDRKQFIKIGIELKKNPTNGKTMLHFVGWEPFVVLMGHPKEQPGFSVVSFPLSRGTQYLSVRNSGFATVNLATSYAVCALSLKGSYRSYQPGLQTLTLSLTDHRENTRNPFAYIHDLRDTVGQSGISAARRVPWKTLNYDIAQSWNLGVDEHGYIYEIEITQSGFHVGDSNEFFLYAPTEHDSEVLSRESKREDVDLIRAQLQRFLNSLPVNFTNGITRQSPQEYQDSGG
jgi:hypothetical protein